MTAKGFHVAKLMDSLYADQILNIDDEAIYCEIQYQRDKSSFAGIAMKVTNEKGFFFGKKGVWSRSTFLSLFRCAFKSDYI